MPNWSYNTLTISGKKQDVENVFQTKKWSWKKAPNLEMFLQSYELTMRSWMPIPKTFKEWNTTNQIQERNYIDYKTGLPKFNSDAEYEKYCKGYKRAKVYQKKKYGAVGWYDYNCKTLGCKWDAQLEFHSLNKNDDEISVTFSFDTPWSPPMAWFEYMVKHYSQNLTWEMECHEESDAFNFIANYANGEYWECETESLWKECDEVCE